MSDSIKSFNNNWINNYKFTSNILPEKIPTGYVNTLPKDEFKIKKENNNSKKLPEITTPFKNNKSLIKTKESIPNTRFVDVQKEVKPYI